jgi:hypothetical protein
MPLRREVVGNHDVDRLGVARAANESVYRAVADRFEQCVAESFQLVPDTAEGGRASLDVQEHVHVAGGAGELQSRVRGVELHHQPTD